jgi:hypothetical protein
MGNRVSIRFVNGEEKSPVLFSQWGGMGFVTEAKAYVADLQFERSGRAMPLDRFEPRTVLVDFIRYFTRGMPRVESDLYLACNENDGDNSDNGHHDIQLTKRRPCCKECGKRLD